MFNARLNGACTLPYAPCPNGSSDVSVQDEIRDDACLACEGPLDSNQRLVCSGCRTNLVAA